MNINNNNFLDVLTILSFITQIVNIQADEIFDKKFQDSLLKIMSQNTLIIKQNEMILEQLKSFSKMEEK